jgi:hypothetical protein
VSDDDNYEEGYDKKESDDYSDDFEDASDDGDRAQSYHTVVVFKAFFPHKFSVVR